MLIPITTGTTDFPITLRQLLANLEKMVTTHPDYLDYPLKCNSGVVYQADLIGTNKGPVIMFTR